ncbi:MAG: hypothetical protein C3F13_13265 [Anaerolineales bacterium]|nr:DUF1232 domain-containing protein [Anaerolineae bacterium]PWB51406.1 MAG: hypothetical protein C3F13_13265 [Anaerolineales bacterium]
MSELIEKWKEHARGLKAEVYALYLAYKDPRTPWYAKVFAVVVVGYAFSPIDLIPDPIPVLGYLDDLLLIPLGAYLAVKMIPPQVMADSRDNAKEIIAQAKPANKVAAAIIVLVWIGMAVLVAWLLYRWLKPR